jgi:chromosome segregation ATPase
MAQVDARPEQIIRSYLELQEGPVEAHILHIKETFEIDDLSGDNLARVANALEQASIGVDPPLSSVPADGKLMLTLRNGSSAPPGTNGTDSTGRSRLAKQARFPRRARRAKAEKPVKPVKVKQPAKLSEEAVAARELLKKALMEGTGGDRVREAMSALEGAAANPEDTLVAITDLLPKFGAEAERRLKESEEALKVARASREQVAERLAGLDTGLGKLVEREGTRVENPDATGKSAQALAKESEEKIAAARRALLEEITAQPWRADLKKRFDELGAASNKVLEARKQEVAQVSERKQQLSAASAKVVAAREAVEAALSDPNARGQLEERVSTLREAEQGEVQAEAALKEARTQLAGAIDTAANGLNAAREQLGQALATEHDAQLRARLEQLGNAQDESVQALRQQLGALTEKLNGDAEAPQQLRTTAAEALRLVRPDGKDDASGPANFEAAIASNRSALEALRPIDELLQVRAQVAAGVLERLSGAERRVAELEEQAKTDKADLAERADALERGRQAAAVADKRRAELESVLRQRHKELQAAREEAQKVASEVAETSKQLKSAQAEVTATAARLERSEAESGNRINSLSTELNQSRAHVETVKTRLAQAEKGVKERDGKLADADGVRARLAKAEAELKDFRSKSDAAKAELEQAERVAKERHEALANQLHATRTQAQQAREELAAGKKHAERQAHEADAKRKQADDQIREADAKRKQAEEQVREAEKRRQHAEEQGQRALARFGESEVEAKELRDRLSKTGKSAKAPAAQQPRKDDGQDQRIAELQAALEQRTTQLEQAQKAATDDASVELKRQLAAQEAELERVRRQERVARKQADRLERQLGASGGAGGAAGTGQQRRRSQEGQLMEAVDSVRRALLVNMEPPAGTPAPEQRPDDQRQQ